MNNSRAKGFQNQREEIIKELVNDASNILLEKNTLINGPSVSKKVAELFKKRKIENKFFVKEQSIGRNKIYNKIWKDYQAKQSKLPQKIKEKEKLSKEFNYFDAQDKYDLLQQDYIEAIDENNLLNMNLKELKKEIAAYKANNSIDKPTNKSTDALEIINLITNMLKEGPIIISKDNTNIIIKDALTVKNDSRFIFPIKKWEDILI